MSRQQLHHRHTSQWSRTPPHHDEVHKRIPDVARIKAVAVRKEPNSHVLEEGLVRAHILLLAARLADDAAVNALPALTVAEIWDLQRRHLEFDDQGRTPCLLEPQGVCLRGRLVCSDVL